MQHTKINKLADGLRELFQKSFSNNGGHAEQVVDLNSLKVLSFLSFIFSIIASIAIVNFFYFSNIVDDVFHASLSFVFSSVLISSFIVLKVTGRQNFLRVVKVVSVATRNKYKNN